MIRAGLALLAAATSAPIAAPQDRIEPPPAFARCATCHATARGAPHGLGNTLFGIYGRRAGTMADFAYSEAMQASQIVWTSATLDAFIADPRAVVPGTSMSSAKLADPVKRGEIVRYLKALR